MNISAFAKNLAALGVELPAPVADVGAIRTALGHLMFVENPTGDFNGELLAGKVTAANAEERVRAVAAELVYLEKAKDVARNADGTLERLERRALIATGDQLVTALRPRFDEAVADTARFVTEHGTDPTPEAVLAAGPDAAEAWQRHKAAAEVFNVVRSIGSDLAAAGYYKEPGASWYIATARDQAHLSQAVSAWRTQRGYVNLIVAGFEVRLNTADEARAVLDGVRTVEDQAAAAAQAEKDAARERSKVDAQRQLDREAAGRRAMAKRYGFR